MANNLCRLRKYRKKKLRTKDPKKFLHYANLYWRYHYKVYGPLVDIWELDNL